MFLRLPAIYARAAFAAMSAVVIAITIFILPSWSQAIPPTDTVAQVIPPPKAFPPVTLEAEAAIVWDIEKKRAIYEKKSAERLPLASLTKVMTALVASNTFSPNDLIPINETALAGGSNAGLVAGDTWPAANLIRYKLVTSSNGAGTAFREAAAARGEDFITTMNATASGLGLTDTKFINETGLDVGPSYSGSYGSARDMALLLSHILETKPELLAATTRPSITAVSASGRTYYGENTNDIVGKIPGLIASKTGFTLNAGGNLAVVFDAGLAQPVAIVVLGSTKEGRFTDVLALVNSTVDYFSE